MQDKTTTLFLLGYICIIALATIIIYTTFSKYKAVPPRYVPKPIEKVELVPVPIPKPIEKVEAVPEPVPQPKPPETTKKDQLKIEPTKRYKNVEYGIASNYWHGQKTANGERFDYTKMTAAHKTIRFGTMVKVSNGNRSVIVRINDRGPFLKGRIIDLSKSAALLIGCPGLCKVKIEY